MRLLLVSLLFVQLSLFAQEDFDQIAIHFNTGYISPGFDHCDKNEDYVRVHGLIHIFIKEKNEIKQITKKLLEESMSHLGREVEVMSCQMVIDFIKHGRIVRTIAISQLDEVRLNQNSFTYYRPNDNIIKFRDEYIEFFEKM